MSVKNEKFDGSVIIGRDLTLGGGVVTKGSSTFEKNLRVEGWLDAPNLRGACKGLFATEEKLNDMYPNPEDGMWAMVGETIPAYVYMAENGEWADTGNLTDGIDINLNDTEIVVNLDELRDSISALETVIDAESQTRATEDNALRNSISMVSREVVNEGALRADADANLRSLIEGMGNIFTPFKAIISVQPTFINQSSYPNNDGLIVFNDITRTFICMVQPSGIGSPTYFNNTPKLSGYGTFTAQGFAPILNKTYNTTKIVYKWNGVRMEEMLDVSTVDSPIVTIEVSGDMSATTFTFTASEWKSILDAYNNGKAVMLKDRGVLEFGGGWFTPNIKITSSNNRYTMYMSYYLANLYGQLVSVYDGRVLGTSVVFGQANSDQPNYAPSHSVFSRIGYSSEEVTICHDQELDYSEEVRAKWDNGEISNFSNDDNLIYPPLVDTCDISNLSRFYFKSGNILTIPSLDTSSARNMAEMMAYCYSLRSIPYINTSNVEDMDSMFYNCNALKSIPMLETGIAKNMSWMFGSCTSLTTIPTLDCHSATNVSNMFNSCKALTTIPYLNTKSATNMKNMFADCTNLEKIVGLDFDSVTDFSGIFSGCNNLKSLLIYNLGKSSLTFYNLSDVSNWGEGCDANRSSLIDSLINFSHDRARANMERATIRLSNSALALLSAVNLSAISEKGYDVVAY